MTKSRSKKQLAGPVSVTAGLAIVVTACGGGGGGGETDSLSIVAANSPWTEGLGPLIQEYEEETGISVEIETYSNEQLNDNLKVRLNAQESNFDLMVYQPQDVMREFVRNGWLLDLSEHVESDAEWGWEDFQASTREAVELEGGVYGVPLMTERHIVYYRSDVLEEEGVEVPETLDDLMAAAETLHRPEENFYGVAIRGGRVPMVTQFSSFLYSFGGDFQDEEGNATIDTPEAIAAYEFYGELAGNYGPPGIANMDWVEASAIFAQGNAAFYLDADSQAYTFLDESNSSVADTVAYASFPEGPAGSLPYNIVPWAAGVNAFSENQDAAWDFLAWVSNEENTKRLLGEATVPVARDSAWEDPEATESFPEGLVEIVQNIGESSVGYDRPRVEQVPRAREIVGGPGVAAIAGEDVASAAARANEEFQSLYDSER
jgi:multiple sugar transport system substrate-binding protein